jgi:hypothetical protein
MAGIHDFSSSSSSSALFSFQDWKFPRSAKAFVGYRGEKNPPNSFLRCVTNTKIPCTFAEFQAMGEKVKFSMTVLSVTCVGWAKAPYKKVMGNKKKATGPDPNAKSLFQLVKSEDSESSVVGVKINSFKKANSNFDRGDFDDSKSCVIHVGQVCVCVYFFLHLPISLALTHFFHRFSRSSCTPSCTSPTLATPSSASSFPKTTA